MNGYRKMETHFLMLRKSLFLKKQTRFRSKLTPFQSLLLNDDAERKWMSEMLLTFKLVGWVGLTA